MKITTKIIDKEPWTMDDRYGHIIKTRKLPPVSKFIFIACEGDDAYYLDIDRSHTINGFNMTRLDKIKQCVRSYLNKEWQVQRISIIDRGFTLGEYSTFNDENHIVNWLKICAEKAYIRNKEQLSLCLSR